MKNITSIEISDKIPIHLIKDNVNHIDMELVDQYILDLFQEENPNFDLRDYPKNLFSESEDGVLKIFDNNQPSSIKLGFSHMKLVRSISIYVTDIPPCIKLEYGILKIKKNDENPWNKPPYFCIKLKNDSRLKIDSSIEIETLTLDAEGSSIFEFSEKSLHCKNLEISAKDNSQIIFFKYKHICDVWNGKQGLQPHVTADYQLLSIEGKSYVDLANVSGFFCKLNKIEGKCTIKINASTIFSIINTTNKILIKPYKEYIMFSSVSDEFLDILLSDAKPFNMLIPYHKK